MLVHKNPQLLARAIKVLSTDNSAFFIHVDKKSNIQDFSGISGNNIFMIEERTAVVWGEFSQVEATMGLIRRALSSAVPYDYFVFLQGSDYPLRSGRYVERFLEERRGYEFLSVVRMPAPGYQLSKINKVRYPSDKPIRRFASRALAKMGLARRDYKKYLGAIDAYAGQAWWTLSRDACKYIIEYTESNPHLADYLRNAFTADEMYFHTILGNSSFRSRLRPCLVFVDTTWSIADERRHKVKADHVRLFEAQENVRVDNQFGSGEVLFARKFSDDDLDLLDRIDAIIERKGGLGQHA